MQAIWTVRSQTAVACSACFRSDFSVDLDTAVNIDRGPNRPSLGQGYTWRSAGGLFVQNVIGRERFRADEIR